MDAAESAFFERELEHVKAVTYDIRFPALKGRQFVPVAGDVDPGAESVTYQQFDKVGRAKIISNNAKDIPRVDVNGVEFNRPVREVADAYGWTIKEVRSAAMAGRSLTTMRASAARRAIEQVIDDVAAVGAPDFGIATGFTNDADVPQQVAPGLWPAATPDQILADVGDAIARISAATEDTEEPNTVIVPPDRWALISTTPRSATSDTTILEFILRAFPQITAVEKWNRLQTAGAGATRRMVVYDRSADKLQQDIPSEFEQLPVQEQGIEFVVNALASTAGMAWFYPLSADYTDTI
jgi:hypothetical protein